MFFQGFGRVLVGFCRCPMILRCFFLNPFWERRQTHLTEHIFRKALNHQRVLHFSGQRQSSKTSFGHLIFFFG